MKKIFLFGGGKILQGLIELLTKDKKYSIIGLHPREADEISPYKLASQYNLDLYESKNINCDSFVNTLKKLDIDFIISCNEKQIFKKPLIELSKIASLNIHGGILPLQRGGGSIYSAFINEQNVGMTVHYLSEIIDGGEIIKQISRPILDTENARDVQNWFFKVGPTLYYEAIEDIIQNKVIQVISQKELRYTYIPAKPEFDEIINWNETSKLIHNKIRARQGPVYNFTYYDNKKLYILKSSLIGNEIANYINSNGQIIQKDSRGIIVKCQDTALLIEKVMYEDNMPFVPNFPISHILGINLYKEICLLKEKIKNLESHLENKNAK